MARVLSVWGPSGSSGRSTIAANLACELALEGKRVLLIDLDTYAPSQALMFGLVDHPPGLAAACRLVAQGRFDVDQVNRLASSFEAGRGQLSVLTGLSSPERWPEVTAEKVAGILEACSELFDFIVLDLAAELEPGIRQVGGVLDRNVVTRTAIGQSDLCLVVVSADAIGVHRYLATHLTVKSLQPNLVILINRLRSSALGGNAKQEIGDTLARFAESSVDWFIPNDADSCDQALLEGVPLAMMKRSSPARQAIAQFVRVKILDGHQKPVKRLAKLF